MQHIPEECFYLMMSVTDLVNLSKQNKHKEQGFCGKLSVADTPFFPDLYRICPAS